MKFDPHFACTFGFQETHRSVIVVSHLRIRRVMADDDIISVGEVDNPVEKILVRHRRRRVVRIIDPKKLGLFGNLHRNRIEVGQELIVFSQRQKVVLTSVEGCTDMIDGVARAGDQYEVAGIHEGNRHIADPFLGADEGDDFFGRIELDIEAFEVPTGYGFAKFRHARTARITMVDGLAGAFQEFFDYDTWCRNVRITDTKVD